MLADYALIESIVDLIYQSVLDESLWSDVMTSMSKLLNASAAQLFTRDIQPERNGLWLLENVNAEQIPVYAEHFAHQDAWFVEGTQKNLLNAGAVRLGSELVDDNTLKKTEFYNDFLRQDGLFHLSCAILGDGKTDDMPATHLGFYRPENAKAFQAEHLDTLKLLFPHLQRAIRLRTMLALHTQQATNNLNALESLSTGVLMLTEQGGVQHANNCALSILKNNPLLKIRNNKLHANHAGDLSQLQLMLRNVIQRQTNDNGAEDSLLLNQGQHSLHIRICPLPRHNLLLNGQYSPVAVALITKPELAHQPKLQQRLIQLYQLTQAELKVAMLMVQGLELAAIAQQLEVSVNTIRFHLKTLYRKTQTNKQSDLIKLMLSMQE